MAVTTVGVLATIAAAGALASATNSYVQGQKEQRRAKNAAKAQQAQQAKQDALALQQRKAQIDAQRMGAGGSGASTAGASTAGLSGSTGSTQTLG